MTLPYTFIINESDEGPRTPDDFYISGFYARDSRPLPAVSASAGSKKASSSRPDSFVVASVKCSPEDVVSVSFQVGVAGKEVFTCLLDLQNPQNRRGLPHHFRGQRNAEPRYAPFCRSLRMILLESLRAKKHKCGASFMKAATYSSEKLAAVNVDSVLDHRRNEISRLPSSTVVTVVYAFRSLLRYENRTQGRLYGPVGERSWTLLSMESVVTVSSSV